MDIPEGATVKIVRAFQPGDILVIEVPYQLSDKDRKALRDQVSAHEARLGIKLLVIDGGMTLAGREEIQTTGYRLAVEPGSA